MSNEKLNELIANGKDFHIHCKHYDLKICGRITNTTLALPNAHEIIQKCINVVILERKDLERKDLEKRNTNNVIEPD